MIYEDRRTSAIETKARKTSGKTYRTADIDAGILQTLAYEYPGRAITVELTTDEFACLCPYSGLPDFARLAIHYVPRRKLIELKSLKYYFYAFRSVKIYNEHAVNKILEDLKRVLNPREISITAEFSNRGGINNRVTARYKSRA